MKKMFKVENGKLYSLGYDGLLSQLNLVEKELNNMGYEGDVVFDNLTAVGNVSNRFFKGVFKNGKFVKEAFCQLVISKDSKVRKDSSEFYKIKILITHYLPMSKHDS